MSEEQDKFEKRKKEALKRKKQLQRQQKSKLKPSTKKRPVSYTHLPPLPANKSRKRLSGNSN